MNMYSYDGYTYWNMHMVYVMSNKMLFSLYL